MKKTKAFSLIELSLVIIIIGILITGILSFSNRIDKIRLDTARTITNSSPVSGIANLIAWYDSTSKNSFLESETGGSLSLSLWYDINPQSIEKQNLSQSTSSSKPTYTKNGINRLPAVYFDGTNDYFKINYNKKVNPDAITIFTVIKNISNSDHGTIISSREVPPQRGYMIYRTPTPTPVYQVWIPDGGTQWGQVGDGTVTSGTTDILAFSADNNSTKFYQNSTLVDSASQSLVPSTQNELRVGAGRNEYSTPEYYFQGYIGELIIFDRVLKTEERTAITNYLAKKWGVNI